MADDTVSQSDSSRRRRLRFNLTSDRAIAGSGFAAAFCSLIFAGYMIGDRGRQPHFPGEEYLAIFARPSHRIQVAAHPAPVLARLDARDDPNGIDPTPTGSIREAGRAEPPDGAALPPARYRLVSARSDAAWVESELGFRQVRPGEILSGFGRVAAIERRNGRWTLLADSGSLLELSGAAFSSPDEKALDGRFARPMIFGRQAQ